MMLGKGVMDFIYVHYEDRHSPGEEDYDKALVGRLERDRFGRHLLSQLVKVNKKWLKRHYQQEFYEGKGKAKDFLLGAIDYVERDLRRWCSEWCQTLVELRQLSESADHTKTRHADIGALLRKLQRKENLGLIGDLVEYAQHKNKDNTLKPLIEDFERELLAAIAHYLPAQSNGVEVARASFNYYTVNKKPKLYYEERIKQLRPQYQKLLSEYEKRKANKAHQKGMLLQVFMQGIAPDKLADFRDPNGKAVNFDLFDGKGPKEDPKKYEGDLKKRLKEVFALTQEVRQWTDEFNSLKERPPADHQKNNGHCHCQLCRTRNQLRQAKKERGFYFIKKAQGKNFDDYLKKWWDYCEKYKNVALEMGQLKAQIKGLEKERDEVALLRYWALLVREAGHYYLWCIPTEQRQGAREFLQKHRSPNGDGHRITCFHSITRRALHKLCFAEESSFAAELPHNLRILWHRVKRRLTMHRNWKKNLIKSLKTNWNWNFIRSCCPTLKRFWA